MLFSMHSSLDVVFSTFKLETLGHAIISNRGSNVERCSVANLFLLNSNQQMPSAFLAVYRAILQVCMFGVILNTLHAI